MDTIILFLNRARWRKNYLRKEIKREVALRQKLQFKVNEAEKFDARKYVDDYLEDCKYELVPKTIKGQRLPKFLIKVCARSMHFFLFNSAIFRSLWKERRSRKSGKI